MTRTDHLSAGMALVALLVLAPMLAYELRFRWLAHECGAGVELPLLAVPAAALRPVRAVPPDSLRAGPNVDRH